MRDSAKHDHNDPLSLIGGKMGGEILTQGRPKIYASIKKGFEPGIELIQLVSVKSLHFTSPLT